jgi:predicted component of type VI protein secretion system
MGSRDAHKRSTEMAYLIMVSVGDEADVLGSRVEIGHRPVMIGRSPHCNVQLVDLQVSREHAEIGWRDGYVLRNLRATNGTYVNDIPIQECRLASGDMVRTGRTQFLFVRADRGDELAHGEALAQTYLQIGLALRHAAAAGRVLIRLTQTREALSRMEGQKREEPRHERRDAPPLTTHKHRDCIVPPLIPYRLRSNHTPHGPWPTDGRTRRA